MGVYGTDNANWYGGSISQHCLENTFKTVFNGGEINTAEEAATFQHDASYTISIVERECSFHSYELAECDKLIKRNEIVPAIKKFRRESWLQTLDEDSYKEAVKEDDLETTRKWSKTMQKKELELVGGKIDFPFFLILLQTFERRCNELSCRVGKYYAHYGADKIFNKNGYFHPHGHKYLIDFVKK